MVIVMFDTTLVITAQSISLIILTLLVIFFGVHLSFGEMIDRSRGKLKLSRYLSVWDHDIMVVDGEVTPLNTGSTLQDIALLLSTHLRVAFTPDNFSEARLVATDSGFDLIYALGAKHAIFYGSGTLHIQYTTPRNILLLFSVTDLGEVG